MSHEVPNSPDAPEFDRLTPKTGHDYLAVAQFLDHFEHLNGAVLNVAAGNTNLALNLMDYGCRTTVVSLDPMYETQGNPYIRNKLAALAQSIPCPSETFALTLCHFGLQHMADEHIPQAIHEMVRVTQAAEDVQDTSRGTILLGPVFKQEELAREIYARQLVDCCGIEDPPLEIQSRSNDALPTLLIKKTPSLSGEKLDAIISAILQTGAMKPKHKSVGERLARLIGRGYSNR